VGIAFGPVLDSVESSQSHGLSSYELSNPFALGVFFSFGYSGADWLLRSRQNGEFFLLPVRFLFYLGSFYSSFVIFSYGKPVFLPFVHHLSGFFRYFYERDLIFNSQT